MSESQSEQRDDSGDGIPDDQLPDDLQPSEDNPLAEGLTEDDDVDRDDLDMLGGKTPEQSDGDSPDDGESGQDEDAD